MCKYLSTFKFIDETYTEQDSLNDQHLYINNNYIEVTITNKL